MTDNTVGAGQVRQDAFTPVENLGYEEARDELVEIVKILELGQMGLDESLKYWERGEALAKRCEDYLDGAAAKVERALGNAENAGAEDTDAEQD
ncbi:exodeoxyribonuclease VII small subunit [Corynebacterium yudongzhengii]|uniref:Exodeoxyribonuclease 7 small subunit n=1 Tax=Corynebacterium yudongzhengii TaxID=2080740 RepID=A0A2U1T6M0_9CORY|nr:exodeoxyribonuclease VII small subunit [Corynebacterium yudongzhengii]AWB82210.1 exodeoxyribonuclease VII small subunit [Corynebacterium yudongzhengii]PWC01660.1 exodeoxyribonuclease VII small subunit [Corynebacterium yudongzhengii]